MEKNKQEQNWWKCKSLVGDFCYRMADDMDSMGSIHEQTVKSFIENLRKNGECTTVFSLPRKMKQLHELVKNRGFAFDLPEHPEKHNGFYKAHELHDPVLKFFGISKPQNLQ
jgi:hypothetical protein